MNTRSGVPWVNPPESYFSAHGYSELLASGLDYKITGKKVQVTIPKSISIEERTKIVENLKQLGFDGLASFSTHTNDETNSIEVTLVVE